MERLEQEIKLTGKDQVSKEIKKVERAYTDMNKAVDKVRKGMDKQEKQTEKVKKKTQEHTNVMAQAKTSYLAVTAAIGGLVIAGRQVVRFMSEAITLAAKQEAEERKLATALRLRGVYTKEVHEGLVQQAAAMERLLAVSDEEIIGLQRFALALDIPLEKVHEYVQASLDLSVALDMDVRSAMRNLVKTLSGMTGELGEAIPKIRELTTEQLKNGEALILIQREFSGYAEEIADTTEKQLSATRIAWDSFLEQLGRLINEHTEIPDFINGLKVSLQEVNDELAKDPPKDSFWGRVFSGTGKQVGSTPGWGTQSKEATAIWAIWSYFVGKGKAEEPPVEVPETPTPPISQIVPPGKRVYKGKVVTEEEYRRLYEQDNPTTQEELDRQEIADLQDKIRGMPYWKRGPDERRLQGLTDAYQKKYGKQPPNDPVIRDLSSDAPSLFRLAATWNDMSGVYDWLHATGADANRNPELRAMAEGQFGALMEGKDVAAQSARNQEALFRLAAGWNSFGEVNNILKSYPDVDSSILQRAQARKEEIKAGIRGKRQGGRTPFNEPGDTLQREEMQGYIAAGNIGGLKSMLGSDLSGDLRRQIQDAIDGLRAPRVAQQQQQILAAGQVLQAGVQGGGKSALSQLFSGGGALIAAAQTGPFAPVAAVAGMLIGGLIGRSHRRPDTNKPVPVRVVNPEDFRDQQLQRSAYIGGRVGQPGALGNDFASEVRKGV